MQRVKITTIQGEILEELRAIRKIMEDHRCCVKNQAKE